MTTLSNLLGANKRFEFESQAYASAGTSTFDVVEMSGTEAIATTYRFELTLVSDESDIDLKKMLKFPAVLRIFGQQNTDVSTPYSGIVCEFEQLHQVGGLYFYRAVLVPRIWQLSRYLISEVYINQTLPAIFKTVIEEENRITSGDYALRLVDDALAPPITTTAVPFVCEYQETHLNFLSRWIEKEGMFYFFEYDSEKEKCIIANDASGFPSSTLTMQYQPDGGVGGADNLVQGFVRRQKPLPHQVILQDFNPRAAAAPRLEAKSIVDDDGIGDVMAHGEYFSTQAQGDRYAKLRAQQIFCGGEVYEGKSTAVAMRSGYFIEMTQHYQATVNGKKYLVTKIAHEGSQAATLLGGVDNAYSGAHQSTFYRNTFSAIPAGVPFRPARVTPVPYVSGSVSATVDGPADGTYADLDTFGQYCVKLRFGRTTHDVDKGSARIRMATPYSGSQEGIHFPLHRGAEVLLSFIGGDPDQPVIMNAVPNSENASVVDSTNNKLSRIKTAGGNLISIDDTKGSELITLSSPSSKSALTIGGPPAAQGNSYFTAGSSNAITVGASNKLSVGSNNSVSVSTDTSISASLATKLSFGMSLTYSLGNDIKWNSSWSQSVTAEDGASVAFKDDAVTKAVKSIKLAAGHDINAQLRQTALDAMKSKVRVGMAAVAAVNFALGATATGVLAGLGEQDSKQKNTFTADTPVNYSTLIGNALGTAVTTGVGVGLLNRSFAALATQYKTVPCKANLTLDADGLIQEFGTDTGTSRTKVALTNNGYRMRSASPTDDTAASVIDAQNGGMEVSAATRFSLESPAVSLGKSNLAGELTGFVAANSAVKMQCSQAYIEATAGKVNVQASTVTIGYSVVPPTPLLPPPQQAALVAARQAFAVAERELNLAEPENTSRLMMNLLLQNYLTTQSLKNRLEIEAVIITEPLAVPDPMLHGFSVDALAAKMGFGNAAIQATNLGLQLKLGDTNTMQFQPMGVAIDGTTIKLG